MHAQFLSYTIEVKQITSQPILSVKRQTLVESLVVTLQTGLGEVWDHIRADGIKHTGRNVVIYNPGSNGMVKMEMGVEILSNCGFSEDDLSNTPSGLVASTVHTGTYDGIPQAHQAILSWCSQNNIEIIGPNWEIYSHWNDDPNKLTTEIYYLVKVTDAK